MAGTEKELEEQLLDVGNRLASPPDNVEELLELLDGAERLLSKVEQSPLQALSTAISCLTKALVAKELFGHLDMDVRIGVTTCISELTRITAPDAPYDDDLMKEVFKRIVQAFEKLDDDSSRSYRKRILILEIVAKVRLFVVMLDLECDTMILEMFHHFLKAIGSNNSGNVFAAMEVIMTHVFDESEDIPSELLSCLLDSIKKDNKDVLPTTHRLAKKVIGSCAKKLKPYLAEVIQNMGAAVSDFDNIVACICHGSFDTPELGDSDTPGEHLEEAESKKSDGIISDERPQGSRILESEVGYPEERVTVVENSPRSMGGNGTVEASNGDSMVEPSNPEQNPDNLKSEAAKQDDISDPSAKTVRDQKTGSSFQLTEVTDHLQTDGDKEASSGSGRSEGHAIEGFSSHLDDPSTKETDKSACLEFENKDDFLTSTRLENGAASQAANENCPEAPPHGGSPPTSKNGPEGVGSAAVTDFPGGDLRKDQTTDPPQGGSPPTSKNGPEGVGSAAVTDFPRGDLQKDQTTDDAFVSECTNSKADIADIAGDLRKDQTTDADIAGDSEGKSGTNKNIRSDSADDVETPASNSPSTTAVDAKNETGARHLKLAGKKDSSRRKSKGGLLGKQRFNIDHQKEKTSLGKDKSDKLNLKGMESSTRSASKASNKDQSHLEESTDKKLRKRPRGREETSETDQKRVLGEELVGRRIKVWWPKDKQYYAGVIQSFDHVSKKHKVLYDDSEIEVLLLKNERYVLGGAGAGKDRGQDTDTPNPDGASEGRRARLSKTSSGSVPKQAEKVAPEKRAKSQSSGNGSSRKEEADTPKLRGRPKGGSPNVTSLRTSARSKEMQASATRERKSGASNLKEDPVSKSLGNDSDSSSEDTPQMSPKLKDGARKINTRSMNAKSNTAAKPKDNPMDAPIKSKSAEKDTVTVSVGKRKGPITPTATTGKADPDNASKRRKSRAEESEDRATKASSDSEKAKESAAASGKRRRLRKGSN